MLAKILWSSKHPDVRIVLTNQDSVVLAWVKLDWRAQHLFSARCVSACVVSEWWWKTPPFFWRQPNRIWHSHVYPKIQRIADKGLDFFLWTTNCGDARLWCLRRIEDFCDSPWAGRCKLQSMLKKSFWNLFQAIKLFICGHFTRPVATIRRNKGFIDFQRHLISLAAFVKKFFTSVFSGAIFCPISKRHFSAIMRWGRSSLNLTAAKQDNWTPLVTHHKTIRASAGSMNNNYLSLNRFTFACSIFLTPCQVCCLFLSCTKNTTSFYLGHPIRQIHFMT